MANPGFAKPYYAGTDIPAYRIVKGTVDATVALAAGATDPILGISSNVDVAQGQMADVVHSQSAEVKAGGNLAFGDWVTSDANGQAVEAVPVAGQSIRRAGIALASAAPGDIIPVLISIGFIPG